MGTGVKDQVSRQWEEASDLQCYISPEWTIVPKLSKFMKQSVLGISGQTRCRPLSKSCTEQMHEFINTVVGFSQDPGLCHGPLSAPP